ncbi:MAG: DUF2079 domain-containing protein [Fuerstiella sp.]
MLRLSLKRPGWVLISLLFLAATALFSGAVSGWLTHPELRQLIWPDDINATVLTLLGGTVSRDAVGNAASSLNPLAVWARMLVVMSSLLAVGQYLFGHWSRPERTRHIQDTLLLTSIVLLAGSVWWVIWVTGSMGVALMAAVAAGSLSLWISITVGFLSWVWIIHLCPGFWREPELNAEPKGHGAIWLMFVCMVGWIGVSYWMNFCLYQQLLIPHGDSAMYEEHLWNIRHGKGFRSYLDQGLFLGEHIQVIHLLLLPLHVLWPSHLLLELAESIALGSCAIPVFLIARRHTRSSRAASLLAMAWLFYFPMHYLDIAIDQKTFRPIALGVPFLFWLIEFSERGQFKTAFVCLLLALSAKEDMALVTFPLMTVMAVMAWLQTRPRHRAGQGSVSECTAAGQQRAVRWFGGMALFSAAYLVAAVLLIIPAFRSGDAVHYSRYFGDLGGSPSELVRTALTEPERVLTRILSARTLLYALVFLGPPAFFPLRRILPLLSGSLTFGMLSLLELSGEAGDLPPVPYHHFHAPLLPIVFWAAVLAVTGFENAPAAASGNLSRWLALLKRRPATDAGALLILLCCLSTSATGSLMPWGVTFWSQQSAFGRTRLYQPTDPDQQQRAAMVAEVLKQIPADARVASTDYIHTRLTHRERSYDYSGYLRAVNNYQPGVPADTEYIVIDTGHRYSTMHTAADVPELHDPRQGWRLLPDTTNGYFLVLQRQPAASGQP